MATKITREILEAYLNCKFKSHLKLAGQQGIRTDYEGLLDETRQKVRTTAIDKILAKYSQNNVARDIILTADSLRQGPSYVLSATLEDEHFSLSFDGLKRVDGPSKLGLFHYVPMLFHETNRYGKKQRSLLEIQGLLLSRLQGLMPSTGIIWHGKDCRTTRVRLNGDLRKTERLIREVKEFVDAASPPRLILNDHCQICEFRQRCHEEAALKDEISLLRGISEKEIKRYARKGIFTVAQLAHTFRPRRKGTKSSSTAERHHHALQALAIRDKRVYVLGAPQLPVSRVNVYLDVEGCPDDRLEYLIGLLIADGNAVQRHSFWANDSDEQDQIFEQFLNSLSQLDDFRVFSYGSYEKAFLQKMSLRSDRKELVDRVLKSQVNILSLIYPHIYFPTYSNGLKEVASYLDCIWTDANASGIQSITWRKRWESTKDEAWKQRLIAYNLEDCEALKQVTEFLYNQCLEAPTTSEPLSRPLLRQNVTQIQETEKRDANYKWGHTRFANDDFNFINKRSHFDYQRDRVFVRTSPKLRKRQIGKHQNRKLPVSQHLEIAPRGCPQCESNDVVTIPTDPRTTKLYTKRAFDLVITSGKIRRRVIECHSGPYRCQQCGSQFLPQQYAKLDKHFHGLKSWLMYGHVENRFSLDSLSNLLRESFGLHFHEAEIHMIKGLVAHCYQDTYERLLRKIVTGAVVHADETEVKLRCGTGYVWVFGSTEEFVFMYRPNREGAFLHDLLKDFHGVLVTDFYAAYDSIGCPQQKCLIHFLRDINQELLDNPFDGELRSVIDPFGVLLREIVNTIDTHGLKRRLLRQHTAEITRYFQFVTAQSFRSEAAEALRVRLLRYREKLFTFIDRDGVTWNNNVAEHGIKRFALYRKDTIKSLDETGIRDYLTLLSICQTCRMRGVSFLQFLLSREHDLERFRSKRHSHRPFKGVQVEMYPETYTPTRLAGLRKLEDRNAQRRKSGESKRPLTDGN
jgi:predicted RecB family nuclease